MKTAIILVRLTFLLALVALPGRLFALEVSTRQVQIEVKYAPISTTLSREMIEQLPIKGQQFDFLKFAGPRTSAEIEKWIRDANPVRTINTAPGARSTIMKDGLQYNFVPTFDGGGTSIRIDIQPAPNFSGTPYHGNYYVPGGSSLLIGVQPPAKPARTEIFFITPTLLPSASGTTYTAPTPSTAGQFSPWEFSAGYNFMQTDEEMVKSLHGFNVTGYYNFSSCFAVGAQFGGYYGTHTWSVGPEKYDMYLDRYSFMAGPRLQCPHGGAVRPYGQVMFGAVWDQAGLDTSVRGYESTSATAFGMSVGLGVNFDVTQHLTITPSVDWFPTFFDAPKSRQDNWRLGLNLGWRF